MTEIISLHIDDNTGWRGGEQQVAYLVEGLAERCAPVFFAGRPQGALMKRLRHHPNVVPVPVPLRGEWDLLSAWRVARVIRTRQVDIVHAHTGHAHASACLAARMAGRGRVVMTRRVDVKPRRNLFSRWKYAQTDHFVTISECIRQILTQYGLPDSRISIVPSSQDPMRLDVAPADRSLLGLTADTPMLLCAAALAEHKDHATLLDAMAIVKRTHPEVRLLLAGEGPMREAIESQIERLDLAEQVRLLGFRDDVPALMRAADMFVLSSHMEGLGSVLIEAMMGGLPIVATAAGGIPELIKDHETGLLVPPRDPEALASAIVCLVDNPSLRIRLGEAGKVYATNHATVPVMVAGNYAVYERMMYNGTKDRA